MSIDFKEKQVLETPALETLPEPTFETLPKYLREILCRVNSIETKLDEKEQPPLQDELFSEFIPKSAVRGKIASSSTLWQWEQKGKIKSYGIGGKRFYKRSELESLIQPIKKDGGR